MNAIILAGGKGSRLAPLTQQTPKPMLCIANRPMLDYVTSQLTYYGINDIVYAVAYKKEQIEARVREYKGISYHVVCDEIPLGTAGSVKNAAQYLDEVFVVISGDCLNNIDLSKMINQHLNSHNLITMAVVRAEDTTKYGVVSMDESCQIRSLIEKPKTNEHGNLINAGVYVISKDLLSYVNYGFSDFARDVFPILVQNCKVGGFFHDGYWSDIGAIGDYYAANFTMRHGGFFPFVETDAQGYDGLSEGGEYSFDSSVHSDVVNSIVGTGACIKHGSVVEQCIIMPCCTVDGKYKNSIVGNGYCVAIEPKVVSQTFSTKYNNISL